MAREVYNRLFRARGWFSRFATASQWFKRSLADEQVVITATLDATEQPDSAAFDVVQANPLLLVASEAPDVAEFVVTVRVNAELAATEPPDEAAFSVLVIAPVIAVLDATEPRDTAQFNVTVPRRRPLASPPSGPAVNLVKAPPPPVRASLGALEPADTCSALITVIPPELATLVPARVPDWLSEGEFTLRADEIPRTPTLLGVRRVPEPEPVPTIAAPILVTMRAGERPDTAKAAATVTDWAAIDNDFLLLT